MGKGTDMYNEELADRILEVLDESFPVSIGVRELKKGIPQFSELPESEWLAAIDALEKQRLVEGTLLRAGYNQVLQAVAKLEVTGSGRERVSEIRRMSQEISRVERMGDLLFDGLAKNLYDDVSDIVRGLARKSAPDGRFAPGRFAHDAAGVVFDRFKSLAHAFVQSYIHLLQQTREGVTRSRGAWLREKSERVWERELARAKGIASRVCQTTGLTPADVHPQVQDLEIRGRELKQDVFRQIEVAVLGQELGMPRGAVTEAAEPERVESDDVSQQNTQDDRARRQYVFVIHGRDERLRKGMFEFLRSIDLKPLEWTKAIALTGKGSPYIGDILKTTFNHAQAVVALLSPDDEARLRAEFLNDNDPPHERELTGQARANVLFESGMALASHEDQTVLVRFGDLRPFSDVAGRHAVMMDNSIAKRQELALKLEAAGCAVDLAGTDWHAAGDLTAPSSPGGRTADIDDENVPKLETDTATRIAGEVEGDFLKLTEPEKEALRQLFIKGELTEQTVLQALQEKGLLKRNVSHVLHRIEAVTAFLERTGPYYESDYTLGYRGRWRINPSLRPILQTYLFRKL
jgi:predicted nucleotide-binding protein